MGKATATTNQSDLSLCGKFVVCARADLCEWRGKKNIGRVSHGRRYKEDPYTNAGEIVAR